MNIKNLKKQIIGKKKRNNFVNPRSCLPFLFVNPKLHKKISRDFMQTLANQLLSGLYS